VGTSPFFFLFWGGLGAEYKFSFSFFWVLRGLGGGYKKNKIKIRRVEGNWQVSPTLQKLFLLNIVPTAEPQITPPLPPKKWLVSIPKHSKTP